MENLTSKNKKEIGKKLFNLALVWAKNSHFPGTQKERLEVVKNIKGKKKIVRGSRSVNNMRIAVEETATEIVNARSLRNKARIGLFQTPSYDRQKPVLLPSGTMEHRLNDMRGKDFFKNDLNFRFDKAPSLSLTSDPQKVGVSQTDYLDWDYYSKATKYPKKIVATTITIPKLWRIRVLKNGLANVGGMTTIDAQLLEGTPEGINVYSATWLSQGRGYDLHAESGFIGVCKGENYHAKTIGKAISGVKRKVGVIKATKKLDNLLAKYSIEHIVFKNPKLTVTITDATATGACQYGIRSWCDSFGFDYVIGKNDSLHGKEKISDVYAAYLKKPMREVRAAILHAIKRQKIAILKVA